MTTNRLPRRLAAGPLLALALALPAAAALESAAPAAPDAAERVVLDTTVGTMTIELYPEVAPRTVAHFRRLVGEGWYDGKPFYRVVAGHVIQAGDGGENDQPTVPAEFNERPHVVGAVGLARDEDPDSGSTEFYVCLAPRPHLDGRYTVFGQVVEGLDVLAAIGAAPVVEKWLGDEEPRVAFHEPVEPVVIERAWLVAGGGEPAAGEAGAAEGDGAEPDEPAPGAPEPEPAPAAAALAARLAASAPDR